MSCNKNVYLKLPLAFGCGCDDDQDCHNEDGHGCGGSGGQTECCEVINEKLEKLAERVTELENSRCDCHCDCGDCGPTPILGEPVGVILPESGVKADNTLYRIDKDMENVDAIPAGYFNNRPIWKDIAREEIDGQAMIKIPAFAYKRGIATSGSNIGKKYLMLAPADTTDPGFIRHPAFMKDGQPVEQFWVGAYQACADPLDSSKLGSVAGTMPLVSLNFANFITRAVKRNTDTVSGFMAWSFYQLAAIQMLYLVEYANADSQASFGQGRMSSPSVTVARVDDTTVAPASYRGIIGLWGNIHQFVDGLRVDASKKAMIWDRSGAQNYISTSFALPTQLTTCYMSVLASGNGAGYDFNDVFLPEQVVSSSSSATVFPDIFIGPVANGLCRFGGNSDAGTIKEAGLFSTYFNNVPSYAQNHTGTRLAKI